jgi:hypothetical protein
MSQHLELFRLSIGHSPTKLEINPKIPERDAGDRQEIADVLVMENKVEQQVQN